MFPRQFYHSNENYERERNGFGNRSRSLDIRDFNHRTTPLRKSLPKGLANIGATCYMNATLQCFYHCKKLTNYLTSDRYRYNNISIPYNSITSEYIKLVKELSYKDGQKDYAPYDFKDILGAKNPLFHGIAANDSKDLILFLLEELAKELAIHDKNNFFGSNIKDFVDQTNEIETFRETVKDFAKGRSIIKDIFYFMVKTTSICKNCNSKLYNFQVMNFIIRIEQIYIELSVMNITIKEMKKNARATFIKYFSEECFEEALDNEIFSDNSNI